ncbi:hypothetical protein Nepgr_023717 [Nepenthes gracilis]|uniref:Uncharacterized protein n=1 Tax=Nepenthes gracilis TaxID=150966 RepID=A0AAD3T3K5_NEPGR|nr:hypothetical protein Nepgr_023717 [Nepenthes gracilis]
MDSSGLCRAAKGNSCQKLIRIRPRGGRQRRGTIGGGFSLRRNFNSNTKARRETRTASPGTHSTQQRAGSSRGGSRGGEEQSGVAEGAFASAFHLGHPAVPTRRCSDRQLLELKIGGALMLVVECTGAAAVWSQTITQVWMQLWLSVEELD